MLYNKQQNGEGNPRAKQCFLLLKLRHYSHRPHTAQAGRDTAVSHWVTPPRKIREVISPFPTWKSPFCGRQLTALPQPLDSAKAHRKARDFAGRLAASKVSSCPPQPKLPTSQQRMVSILLASTAFLEDCSPPSLYCSPCGGSTGRFVLPYQILQQHLPQYYYICIYAFHTYISYKYIVCV